MQKGAFSELPISVRWQILQKEGGFTALNPLPRHLINQGRWTLISGEKIRSGHHTQTNATDYNTSHLLF